jgi:hypothetical protein
MGIGGNDTQGAVPYEMRLLCDRLGLKGEAPSFSCAMVVELS